MGWKSVVQKDDKIREIPERGNDAIISHDGAQKPSTRRNKIAMLPKPCTIVIFCLIIAQPVNARLYLGADAGINSKAGLISGITFIQERFYTLLHLDLENESSGFLGIAYRIPAKVGFVPLGISFISGGEKHDSEAAFGLYTGFQRDLTKNTMVYMDFYITPKEFSHNRLPFAGIDIGLSCALFSILGDALSSGYVAE